MKSSFSKLLVLYWNTLLVEGCYTTAQSFAQFLWTEEKVELMEE